ncbi:GGDEF domain-containing protein [Crossiella sp. SN42]|uniref:GGDEF domain-containing protein n=1 Tax=Crossiella sp. SN42 TaxID=2944808 RepID=UPI00207C31AD|nr:GGDEF domain-containing protein [Crossiella sp. SN42]MCO1575869.1 GGDEF domain-containing protein [Crossiella sp. SN42]
MLPDRWQWAAEAPGVLRDASARRGAVLLLLDLDNFKAVNDTFGHRAGDAVLRAVASTLRTVVGQEDALARYGGDEFVALCSVADPHEAIAVTHELAGAVRELVVLTPGLPGQPTARISNVTAAIGAAFLPAGYGDVRGIDEAMGHADAALLEAKGMDEDRTCLVFLGAQLRQWREEPGPL